MTVWKDFFKQFDPSRFVTKRRDKRSMVGGIIFIFSATVAIIFVSVSVTNRTFNVARFAYCDCGDGQIETVFFTNVCPWLHDGMLCDEACMQETQVDISGRLLNSAIEDRIRMSKPLCEEAANVSCYHDIPACDYITSASDILNLIGSTWGWVTLFIIPCVLVWNLMGKIYYDPDLDDTIPHASTPEYEEVIPLVSRKSVGVV